MATEHSDDINNSNIAAVRSYSFIKPGSNKVTVSVRNLTSKEITLKAVRVIGQIEAAIAVPPMLAPKSENKLEPNKDVKSGMESISQLITDERQLTSVLELNPPANSLDKRKLTQEEIQLLMGKINLSGIKNWTPEEQ